MNTMKFMHGCIKILICIQKMILPYDSCVLAIREGMIKHTQVADPEINLSATMIEIARTLNG